MPSARTLTSRPLALDRTVRWMPLDDPYYMLAAVLATAKQVAPLVVARDALVTVEAHLRQTAANPCGLLIGDTYRCPRHEITYLLVESAEPAPAAHHGGDPEAAIAAELSSLRAAVERSGRRVVGWYRGGTPVRPRISIRDAALHQTLFPEPEHVALLRDGTGSNRAGAFVRVEVAERRLYSIPFREIVTARAGGEHPSSTAVGWINYRPEAEVVPLSEAELARAAEKRSDAGATPSPRRGALQSLFARVTRPAMEPERLVPRRPPLDLPTDGQAANGKGLKPNAGLAPDPTALKLAPPAMPAPELAPEPRTLAPPPLLAPELEATTTAPPATVPRPPEPERPTLAGLSTTAPAPLPVVAPAPPAPPAPLAPRLPETPRSVAPDAPPAPAPVIQTATPAPTLEARSAAREPEPAVSEASSTSTVSAPPAPPPISSAPPPASPEPPAAPPSLAEQPVAAASPPTPAPPVPAAAPAAADTPPTAPATPRAAGIDALFEPAPPTGSGLAPPAPSRLPRRSIAPHPLDALMPPPPWMTNRRVQFVGRYGMAAAVIVALIFAGKAVLHRVRMAVDERAPLIPGQAAQTAPARGSGSELVTANSAGAVSATARAPEDTQAIARFALERIDEAADLLDADLSAIAAAFPSGSDPAVRAAQCAAADSANTRALMHLEAINLAQRYLPRQLSGARLARVNDLSMRAAQAASRLSRACP